MREDKIWERVSFAQGIAIVRELRQLEQRTCRRIHELFDLVCGTSTGGILAVALALKQLSLEDCEQIYRCALYFFKSTFSFYPFSGFK